MRRKPKCMRCGLRALDGVGDLPLCISHFFHEYWLRLGYPPLTPEHYFALSRKWRFDLSEINARVAVELDGGTWVQGRHTTGVGHSADAEKANAAVSIGWAVFRFTGDMLRKDTQRSCEMVKREINRRLTLRNALSAV